MVLLLHRWCTNGHLALDFELKGFLRCFNFVVLLLHRWCTNGHLALDFELKGFLRCFNFVVLLLHRWCTNGHLALDFELKGMLLLLSTPLHQRAASRVQHPKSCGSQQSLPPGGKESLHFVGIRPEVQARNGGW